jgi:hypothetical protein
LFFAIAASICFTEPPIKAGCGFSSAALQMGEDWGLVEGQKSYDHQGHALEDGDAVMRCLDLQNTSPL